ncbi:hypothetical protein RQM59_01370 [Flavobacteriaceae bacterium S356]|uniref:Porin n=1 Tax=Asprobacillus argus TaxID=3076534 RepID=A0ABU3LBD8_9FLAO|nr:hypothetical protein [Flavobacteriaceae bacterium S356]
MLRALLLSFILCVCSISFGQERDTISIKNGIEKPSLLSTHHFGMFSARIHQNFKIAPPKKSSFRFSMESGNNFHPFVETYLPKDETVRQELSQVIWYNRRFTFVDQATTPAEYMNIVIDAVYKGFRFDFNTKIAENHELGITLRTYLVTKGNYPFSLFTSDQSLEWFHSNIAGGEDPFGRKFYGLNQVNVKYTDRNGRVLELQNGDFIFSGIELNHFYYPEFLSNHEKNIYVNMGTHMGLNTSKFNPSIDIGFSSNVIKKWLLKSNNELRFGFGAGVLRKNLINFKDVIDLGNNQFLGSLEGMLEFTKYTAQGNYHSFGINYMFQTRYNKKREASYYYLIGLWSQIHSGWQNGIEKLYQNLSSWNFIYTYGKHNYQISIYLKEDLRLNNAPDVQTGISVKIPIKKL